VRNDSAANLDAVVFDVDVKMDEESRTNEELTISFLITINTKPNIVQFEARGKAVIGGGRKSFEAALAVDEKSKVPKVLQTIYQRIFTSLYILSTLLETPYPPPDLIHSPEKIREPQPEHQIALDAEMQQAQRAAKRVT
jgi:hypothetical protein